MKDSYDIYENIISTMDEGVFVFDDNGITVLMNDRAKQMLQLPPDTESISLRSVIAEGGGRYDEFVDALFAAVYDGELKTNTTISFGDEDSQKRYILTTSLLHTDVGVKQIMAVMNDVTELEKLHETFGRYMSDDVADAILNSPQGLDMGGQVMEVTILMSDLRGFTAMCESMDAEAVTDMLGVYFGRMYDCISSRSGTIIEFLGDGILAVFGAPVRSDSHAANAVAAAVDMQKAMKEVNEYNLSKGYPTLAMGIGIHTGDAVVGNIGCDKRTKYGVLGSNVNLTGRIESYTSSGQILISKSVMDHIREELLIEQETLVSAKGVAQKLHIIQVIGILGGYNTIYEMEREKLRELSYPHIFTMRKLIGKHVTEDVMLGRLLAVSGEQAVIESDGELKVFDNIRMDICGETYAKIIKLQDGKITVDFTALPDGFNLFLNEVIKL